MTSPFSLLSGVGRADIRLDPFPHLVIENCLDPDLYAELDRTFPEDQTLLDLGDSAKGGVRPNSRHDVVAHRIQVRPDLFSPAWLAFTAHHVSPAFYQEVAALLGPEIRALHPGLEARLGARLEALTTTIMNNPAAPPGQVDLDCHIGVNTPSRRRSSVRRVHTDGPDELFAALLYFRRPQDSVSGGDLELFRWKSGAARRFVGSEVDEGDVERVGVIPYRANTAVIFLNSDQSLHAVSARDPSPVSRRLVNIMGRVGRSLPEGLFEKRQKTGLWAMGRRALQRRRFAGARY